MYSAPATAYRAHMSAGQPHPASEPHPALHVATIAHLGQLWDAYLEFEDDPRQPHSFRGRLRFDPAGAEQDPGGTQTTVIIIEDSYEEAVAKARAFDERQLQNLLRSTLPDPE